MGLVERQTLLVPPTLAKANVTRFWNPNNEQEMTYYAQTAGAIQAAWELRHKPVPSIACTLPEINSRYKDIRRWTREEFIAAQPSHKRNKYLAFLEAPHMPSNIIKTFIKKEKIAIDKYRAPRMIQARNPFYTMELGRYTRPLEEMMLLKDKQSGRFDYAKGLTPRQLGRTFESKSNKMKQPLYVCMDHTTFDARVNAEHLRHVHRWIRKHYPKDKELEKLLLGQINNVAVSFQGNVFKWKGTIASGDITTSFYGCLINKLMLQDALTAAGVRKYELMINGDDSIVITENRYKHLIPELPKLLLERNNMLTKIDLVTNDPAEVEFCRMHPRQDNDGNIMFAIAKERQEKVYGMTHKINNTDLNTYQKDIALANMIIYRNTPRQGTFERLYNERSAERYRPLENLRILDPILAQLVEMATNDMQLPDHATQLPVPLVEKVNLKTWKPVEYPVRTVDHVLENIY